MKQEIGNFLRLLGAVLVTWLGAATVAQTFPSGSFSDSNWCWVPRVCGSVLVLAGTLAAVVLLYQKTVRIKVDTAGKTAEFSPGPDKPG